MNKYSHIRNMDDLAAAQQQLQGRIRRKGTEVMDRLEGIRTAYAPSNLLSTGINEVSNQLHIKDAMLRMVRTLKYRLSQ